MAGDGRSTPGPSGGRPPTGSGRLSGKTESSIRDNRLTTGDYLTHWLEHEVKPARRPATYRAYEQTVRTHLILHLGRIPLAKYGRALRNVAALMDAPEAPRKVVESFSADEARARMVAVRRHGIEPLILTALGTGARQGELLALRWQDTDLDAGMISIRRTVQSDGTAAPPKTESSIRDVTLPHFAAEALRACRREQLQQRLAAGPGWHDDDLVFIRRDGRPLPVTSVRDHYARALKRADGPDAGGLRAG